MINVACKQKESAGQAGCIWESSRLVLRQGSGFLANKEGKGSNPPLLW